MFRRKKPDEETSAQTGTGDAQPGLDKLSATPPRPFGQSASLASKPAVPVSRPEIPRRVDMPNPQAHGSLQRHDETGGKKLIVGRDICLSGEISTCEKLIVEGQVEATLQDCRSIEIARSGTFKGTAEIDNADISGRFDGTLTVRRKLTIRSSGVVVGKILYGELAVDSGGVLTGDIQVAEKAEGDQADGPPDLSLMIPRAPEPSSKH